MTHRYRLNPTIDLAAIVSAQVRGRDRRRHVLDLLRDRALLSAIIDALNGRDLQSLPYEVEVELANMGVLLPRKDVPRPVRYSCAIEPAISARSCRRYAQRSDWMINTQIGQRAAPTLAEQGAWHSAFAGDVTWLPGSAGVMWPYEVSPKIERWLTRLANDRVDPNRLPPDIGAALVDCGAIKRPGAADIGHAPVPVISQLVPRAHVRALARYYRALRREGAFNDPAERVPLRPWLYNETVAAALQRAVLGVLNEITGQRSVPTFNYVAWYDAGSVLEPHVDRDDCSWNVSIPIASTPPGYSLRSALHIDVAGEVHSVRTEPGDAIFYRGVAMRHHRDQVPPGSSLVVCLLHYGTGRAETTA